MLKFKKHRKNLKKNFKNIKFNSKTIFYLKKRKWNENSIF